jgi:hypothetical protein
MCFRATLNNISVISWQSVLLVEKTEENYQQNVSHKVVSSALCYKGKNMCQVRRVQREWKRKSQLKRRCGPIVYYIGTMYYITTRSRRCSHLN